MSDSTSSSSEEERKKRVLQKATNRVEKKKKAAVKRVPSAKKNELKADSKKKKQSSKGNTKLARTNTNSKKLNRSNTSTGSNSSKKKKSSSGSSSSRKKKTSGSSSSRKKKKSGSSSSKKSKKSKKGKKSSKRRTSVTSSDDSLSSDSDTRRSSSRSRKKKRSKGSGGSGSSSNKKKKVFKKKNTNTTFVSAKSGVQVVDLMNSEDSQFSSSDDEVTRIRKIQNHYKHVRHSVANKMAGGNKKHHSLHASEKIGEMDADGVNTWTVLHKGLFWYCIVWAASSVFMMAAAGFHVYETEAKNPTAGVGALVSAFASLIFAVLGFFVRHELVDPEDPDMDIVLGGFDEHIKGFWYALWYGYICVTCSAASLTFACGAFYISNISTGLACLFNCVVSLFMAIVMIRVVSWQQFERWLLTALCILFMTVGYVVVIISGYSYRKNVLVQFDDQLFPTTISVEFFFVGCVIVIASLLGFLASCYKSSRGLVLLGGGLFCLMVGGLVFWFRLLNINLTIDGRIAQRCPTIVQQISEEYWLEQYGCEKYEFVPTEAIFPLQCASGKDYSALAWEYLETPRENVAPEVRMGCTNSECCDILLLWVNELLIFMQTLGFVLLVAMQVAVIAACVESREILRHQGELETFFSAKAKAQRKKEREAQRKKREKEKADAIRKGEDYKALPMPKRATVIMVQSIAMSKRKTVAKRACFSIILMIAFVIVLIVSPIIQTVPSEAALSSVLQRNAAVEADFVEASPNGIPSLIARREANAHGSALDQRGKSRMSAAVYAALQGSSKMEAVSGQCQGKATCTYFMEMYYQGGDLNLNPDFASDVENDASKWTRHNDKGTLTVLAFSVATEEKLIRVCEELLFLPFCLQSGKTVTVSLEFDLRIQDDSKITKLTNTTQLDEAPLQHAMGMQTYVGTVVAAVASNKILTRESYFVIPKDLQVSIHDRCSGSRLSTSVDGRGLFSFDLPVFLGGSALNGNVTVLYGASEDALYKRKVNYRNDDGREESKDQKFASGFQAVDLGAFARGGQGKNEPIYWPVYVLFEKFERESSRKSVVVEAVDTLFGGNVTYSGRCSLVSQDPSRKSYKGELLSGRAQFSDVRAGNYWLEAFGDDPDAEYLSVKQRIVILPRPLAANEDMPVILPLNAMLKPDPELIGRDDGFTLLLEWDPSYWRENNTVHENGDLDLTVVSESEELICPCSWYSEFCELCDTRSDFGIASASTERISFANMNTQTTYTAMVSISEGSVNEELQRSDPRQITVSLFGHTSGTAVAVFRLPYWMLSASSRTNVVWHLWCASGNRGIDGIRRTGHFASVPDFLITSC